MSALPNYQSLTRYVDATEAPETPLREEDDVFQGIELSRINRELSYMAHAKPHTPRLVRDASTEKSIEDTIESLQRAAEAVKSLFEFAGKEATRPPTVREYNAVREAVHRIVKDQERRNDDWWYFRW